MPPSLSTTSATARSQKSLSPRSPAMAIALRPSRLDDPLRLRGVVMLAQIEDGDVGALAREQGGDGAADAAVGAGDQGDLAVEPAGARIERLPFGLRLERAFMAGQLVFVDHFDGVGARTCRIPPADADRREKPLGRKAVPGDACRRTRRYGWRSCWRRNDRATNVARSAAATAEGDDGPGKGIDDDAVRTPARARPPCAAHRLARLGRRPPSPRTPSPPPPSRRAAAGRDRSRGAAGRAHLHARRFRPLRAAQRARHAEQRARLRDRSRATPSGAASARRPATC